MKTTENPRAVRPVLIGAALLGSVLIAACGTSTVAGRDVDSPAKQATRASRDPTVSALPPAATPPTDERATPAATPSPAAAGSHAPGATPRGSVPSPTNAGSLRSHVPGQKIAYVKEDGIVSAAATYDQIGHIQFWLNTQGGWIKRGSSTYPTPIAHDEPVMVTGYQLNDKAVSKTDKTAVWIYAVSGEFTTDSSGNLALFGPGKKGWGALADDDTTLVSTGAGASTTRAHVLFHNYYVAPKTNNAGTSNCPTNQPLYKCSTYNDVNAFWVWDNATEAFTSAARSTGPGAPYPS